MGAVQNTTICCLCTLVLLTVLLCTNWMYLARIDLVLLFLRRCMAHLSLAMPTGLADITVHLQAALPYHPSPALQLPGSCSLKGTRDLPWLQLMALRLAHICMLWQMLAGCAIITFCASSQVYFCLRRTFAGDR